MAKNILYLGSYKQRDADGRTHFAMWGTFIDFNDSPMICRTGGGTGWEQAGVWDHEEMHFTRAQCVYVASAANTTICASLVPGGGTTGPQYLIGSTKTTVGCYVVIDTGPIDLAMDPRSDGQASTQFANAVITGINANDDITFFFAGWFRDAEQQDLQFPTPPPPAPVKVDQLNVWPWKRG